MGSGLGSRGSLGAGRPDGWPLDFLAFWPQVELCRILESETKYRLVIQIMGPLVKTLSQLVNTAQDGTTLRDLSTACCELGEFEMADGRREAALQVFRRGHEISERIVEHFGETTQSLRDVSVSVHKVGDVDMAGGRRDAALPAFQRGLDIRERIVEHFGETPQGLWDIFCSRWRMGKHVEPEQAGEHHVKVSETSASTRGR